MAWLERPGEGNLSLRSVAGRPCPLDGAQAEVLAGTQGFEPRYAAPEAAVLPLDDVPTDLYSSKGAAAKSRRRCRRVVH